MSKFIILDYDQLEAAGTSLKRIINTNEIKYISIEEIFEDKSYIFNISTIRTEHTIKIEFHESEREYFTDSFMNFLGNDIKSFTLRSGPTLKRLLAEDFEKVTNEEKV